MRDHYFEFLPKIRYDMGQAGVVVETIDITRRFKINELLKNRVAVFIDYYNGNALRPDIVAQKYYGDPYLDWLVLIVNDVFDPYFDWPMDHWTFTKHIKKKYGSLSVATQTVHHYEHIIEPERFLADGTRVPEYVIWVDRQTYNTIPDNERRSLSLFDVEKQENDARKKLKLVHKSYVPQIMKEVRALYG